MSDPYGDFLKANPLTEVEVATVYTFVNNVRKLWYPDRGPAPLSPCDYDDDLGDVMDILVTDYG